MQAGVGLLKPLPMRQPSLFDSPGQTESPLSGTDEQIRRKVLGVLKRLRASASLPWPEREAKAQARNFPALAKLLPPGEAEVLIADFQKEMRRLKG